MMRVEMVPQHRELDEPEPKPIAPPLEARRDRTEAPPRPQVPHVRQHPPRRKHRIPRRQHRPPPMRHLLQLPFPRVARAALLLPPPTPGRQPQLHLFRLPLPPHHPAPPTNPAVLLGDRFYGGGLTQERGEASCEAGCGGAPSRDESASGRARWTGEAAFRR